MINLTFNPLVSATNRRLLKQTIAFVQSVVQNYFHLRRPIDVYVYVEPSDNDQGGTLTAVTHESDVVFCKIFTNQIDTTELSKTLIHELNHAYKNQLFSTESAPTLFNWLLLEGLAQTFEKQVASDFGLDWSKFYLKQDLSRTELISGLARVLEIDQTNELWNHYDWFYNFDTQADLPSNFAYKIGEFLLDEFCRTHRLTPAEAIVIENGQIKEFAKKLCKKLS